MRASATAADTIFPLGGLKKSAQDPIPYSREALKQDLLGCGLPGNIAKPIVIATRFMDTSAPCSIW